MSRTAAGRGQTTALVLYGATATGKDTVTKALTALHPHYQQYIWVKLCGPATENRYRTMTSRQLTALRSIPGEVLWESPRELGTSTCLIERTHLSAMVASAEVPVVHFDQPAAIEAVTTATPRLQWRVVEVWCPRMIAVARLTHSDPNAAQRRLAAYDATPPLINPQLWLDTSKVSPTAAAKQIHALFADPRESHFITPQIATRAARYPPPDEP